jgi:hypothetical protein
MTLVSVIPYSVVKYRIKAAIKPKIKEMNIIISKNAKTSVVMISKTPKKNAAKKIKRYETQGTIKIVL